MRNARRQALVVFVLAALAAAATAWTGRSRAQQPASGTVSGSVAPPAPSGTVVWLEGVRAGTWHAPHDTPSITQHGATFHPEFVVVVAGQTIAFPNDDRMAHNVFSVSPARPFDLGHYRQGESRSVVFDQPGIVDVFCNIHDNMHATIVVVPSTFFALPDAQGHFTIPNVPAGAYRVGAYSVSAGRASGAATVTAGATASVRLAFSRR